MRRVVLGGFIVSCDFCYDPARIYPGELRHCPEEFRSASIASVLPKQLAAAGWSYRSVGRDRKTQDFCPMHTERMQQGKAKMPATRDTTRDVR